MAGTTPYLHLAYFDYGDDLITPINVAREVDRFLLIDKQLYGLYQIFGDGVTLGWDIYNNGFNTRNGISIGITDGAGVIQNMAVKTNFPAVLYGLPPASSIDIYAASTSETAADRAVNFIAVNTGTAPPGAVIKLSTVVTSDNGIESIDNTVRNYISFRQIVIDEVYSHKHRGIPTKIDLQTEVKNQLPNARIENLEADFQKMSSRLLTIILC